MPLLWILVEYKNPNVVYYAKRYLENKYNKYSPELPLLFSACGDRTLRNRVHEMLRSESPDTRKRAASCILSGKNINNEDLDILKYISINDPDPNVKKYVSEELAKLKLNQ